MSPDKHQKLVSNFKEPARRQTFKTWPFRSNQQCSADKMAEAGFIYTGSSHDLDSAQCFFCLKHLDGWESSDDPWGEHLKHSGQCEFAKMQKAQSHWTVAEWFEIYSQYRRLTVKRHYDKIRKDIKEFFKIMRGEYE